jgi:hypothetical protein
VTTTPTDRTAPAELVNADIDRVDGVDGPANLTPFLLIKAADTQATAPDAEAQPGDPEWEAADAANARVAAAILAELSARLDDLVNRESAELTAGTSDWQTIDGLAEAACAVKWALNQVAAFAFTEQTDADGIPENVTKSAEAVLNAAAADQENTTTMTDTELQALVDKAVNQALDARDAAQSAAAAPSADTTGTAATPAVTAAPVAPATAASAAPVTATTTADFPAPATTPAEAGPADTATPASVAAPAPDGTAVDVVKAALATVLEPLAKAVTAQTQALTGLAERVEKVENAPMPGGPLLRGATGAPADGAWTITRGQAGKAAEGLDPEAVVKALQQIADPRRRDDASQAIATAMHPLLGQTAP